MGENSAVDSAGEGPEALLDRYRSPERYTAFLAGPTQAGPTKAGPESPRVLGGVAAELADALTSDDADAAEAGATGGPATVDGPDERPDPADARTDRHADRSCGLVVGGGLDVALATPLAACALAEHFVFRRVGGTSAAAVTAAAVATAELGRSAPATGTASAGFAGLADVVGWLTAKGGEGREGGDGEGDGGLPRLARLFPPADDAATLHRLATAVLRPGGGRGRGLRAAAAVLAGLDVGARRVVTLLWAGAVLGSAGVIVALWRSSQVSGWLLPFVAVPLVVTFALAAAAGTALLGGQVLRRAGRDALETDGWGLVSGSAEGSGPVAAAGADDVPPLFAWVADRLDDLAGVPAGDGHAERYALTFGDLWLGRVGRRTAADVRLLRRAAVRPELRAVDLVLTASDLSAGRGFLLPFGTAERPGQLVTTGYLFCRTCLIGVLPARVADQLVLLSPGAPAIAASCPRHPDQPLHRLPEPWDVPVVLAVRLAASVPGLLRAVPLHRADDGSGPRTHWFCDGAVTGGLPPGYLDVPLPSRPTFSFGPATGDEAVLVPDQDDSAPVSPWRPVRGAGGLAGAVVGAALGGRALLRAQAPARRGGTALLGGLLGDGPDGLRGTAGPGVFRTRADVLRLAAAGHRAGTALRERFTAADDGSAVHGRLDRYRWVRLRTALGRWREESLALGVQGPLYTDLALGYRVPAGLASWFDPPLDAGSADPAWGDALAAMTHLRSLADGGVLDWDTDWGAAPSDPHDALG